MSTVTKKSCRCAFSCAASISNDKQKGLKYKIQQMLVKKPIFITPAIVSETLLDDFLEGKVFFKPSISGTIQPTKSQRGERYL
jgi:hypothetical protein